jgi:hypothetical protein
MWLLLLGWLIEPVRVDRQLMLLLALIFIDSLIVLLNGLLLWLSDVMMLSDHVGGAVLLRVVGAVRAWRQIGGHTRYVGAWENGGIGAIRIRSVVLHVLLLLLGVLDVLRV